MSRETIGDTPRRAGNTYDPKWEGYDPEIHGTLVAPPSQRGMALAVAFAGAAILIALGYLAMEVFG